MAIIYVITNTITGKMYVGSSSMPEDGEPTKKWNWRRVLRGASSRPISHDLYEFGIESFIYRILEHCYDSEQYDRKEYWIKELNTQHPDGYNKRLDDKGNRAKAYKRRHE